MFSSELDLKAHQVEVHGADMSSKDKKDARRVLAEFEFDDTGGSSRRGRRDRGDREREREPPPQIVQVQARVAGRRREAFGGHLTEGTTQATQPSVPSGRASPTREDLDPLIAEYVRFLEWFLAERLISDSKTTCFVYHAVTACRTESEQCHCRRESCDARIPGKRVERPRFDLDGLERPRSRSR